METSRKNLKSMSLLVLVLAALALARNIMAVVSTGFKVDNIPEGMTEAFVKATMIGAFIGSIILLIPQIYVGIKGLKIANNPEISSKGCIIVAKVLLVLAIIATVFSVADLAKAADKIDAKSDVPPPRYLLASVNVTFTVSPTGYASSIDEILSRYISSSIWTLT